MTVSIENKTHRRKLYQVLMTIFEMNDIGKKNSILPFCLQIFTFSWLVPVTMASGYVIWTEIHVLPTAMAFEIVQYIMGGILYIFILTVTIFKNDTILSNYKLIATDFVRWSEKRETNPNGAYKKTLRTCKYLSVFCYTTWLTLFLTFYTSIKNRETIPLDNRSNFVLFWPKFVKINGIGTYGIIFLLQMTTAFFTYSSVLVFNIGISASSNELDYQFKMLLAEIKEAFDHRMDRKFPKRFIECIIHHQTIIKFVDDFKSYFKWIILVEIIITNALFALTIYGLLKEDVPFGNKVKTLCNIFFTLLPFCYHCHVGEEILSKHKRLAEHIYNMTWYDMSISNKQLIVIMFQRTQKDLSLSSALFFNITVSRSMMFQFLKQVYTILNVLLKT